MVVLYFVSYIHILYALHLVSVVVEPHIAFRRGVTRHLSHKTRHEIFLKKSSLMKYIGKNIILFFRCRSFHTVPQLTEPSEPTEKQLNVMQLFSYAYIVRQMICFWRDARRLKHVRLAHVYIEKAGKVAPCKSHCLWMAGPVTVANSTGTHIVL